MDKLIGTDYYDYWRKRMARGPDQVGFNGRDAEEQGKQIWQFVRPRIQSLNPQSILDFGCGYGRMMRRLRDLWPDASICGVDISSLAMSSIHDCGDTELYEEIPAKLRVDLIFSCLTLQHVTDDGVFSDICKSLARILNPGGHLILFENTSTPCADHVRDDTDYSKYWPRFDWQNYGTLFFGDQEHTLAIGRKRERSEGSRI